MGIDPTISGWDSTFKNTAAYSAKSLRDVTAKSTEDSYKGGWSGFGIAVEAAYTKSKSIQTLTLEESTRSTNSVHMNLAGRFYGLNLLNPNPTEPEIQAWLSLQNTDSQKEFNRYFETFGTHYFLKGVMGGNLVIDSSASASTTENGISQAQDQGNCISAKASAKFFGTSGEAATKMCQKSSAVTNATANFQDQISTCTVRCEGGVCSGNSVCDKNPDPTKSLEAFR